jgi:hypothetical protein
MVPRVKLLYLFYKTSTLLVFKFAKSFFEVAFYIVYQLPDTFNIFFNLFDIRRFSVRRFGLL